MTKKERALACYSILANKYPNVGTFLTHDSSFQLLIAVILSAQCTDERVNKVTPGLFKSFPDSETLSKSSLFEVKELIKSVNFFNNKSKNIIKTAQMIEDTHDGAVPNTLEKLITLPGVGRKTANVVLGQAFNTPGITADTHVKRVMWRLGFTKHTDPIKVEIDLMKVWPKETWIDFSSITILHGREKCMARTPNCIECELKSYCNYYKKLK
jgi:endonuclease III